MSFINFGELLFFDQLEYLQNEQNIESHNYGQFETHQQTATTKNLKWKKIRTRQNAQH